MSDPLIGWSPLVVLALAAGATLAVAAFAAAAVADWRWRTIPNRLVALAALGATPVLLHPAGPAPVLLAMGALFFGLAVLAFAAGLIGGGDAKLLGAAGLWTGVDGLGLFLAVEAAVTLLLAGRLFLARARGPVTRAVGGAVADAGGAHAPGFPLGVAIGAAGLAVAVARTAALAP